MKLKLILVTVLANTLFTLCVFGVSKTGGSESDQIVSHGHGSKNYELLICKGEIKVLNKANEVVLFDFGLDDAASAWNVVNDAVMGGISSSRMVKSENGKAAFIGRVSLENNGGFASVRSPRMQDSLGNFEGIVFRVRGDGKRYKCEQMYTLKKRKIKRENIPSYTELKLKGEDLLNKSGEYNNVF